MGVITVLSGGIYDAATLSLFKSELRSTNGLGIRPCIINVDGFGLRQPCRKR
jgi:hypothetical protein